VKLTTHLFIVRRSKNAWSYTSTPQYAFRAWCLVKHRDNFTFTSVLYTKPLISMSFYKKVYYGNCENYNSFMLRAILEVATENKGWSILGFVCFVSIFAEETWAFLTPKEESAWVLINTKPSCGDDCTRTSNAVLLDLGFITKPGNNFCNWRRLNVVSVLLLQLNLLSYYPCQPYLTLFYRVVVFSLPWFSGRLNSTGFSEDR
jgi:hypothetical protein